jgi:hypothetical protein
MMTGLKKGMNFCALQEIRRFEPYCAMFQDGVDPLAKEYED